MFRFRAGRLALLFTSMLSLLALTASLADAAEADAPGAVKYRDEMTFIGDSVTAGFGYCGYSENAKNVNCKPNDEMRNNWYLGDNSLKDCAPPDGGRPTDACSNNNLDGQPWLSEPWEAGADSPNIAYPFQIAARQTGPEKAEVSDWALTGSTPADWDPDGGAFGNVLGRLKNQYVGMTLGANPLLSYFTNIDISIPFTDVEGPYVDSTGYKAGIWGFRSWYAGPIDNAVNCLRNQWNKIRQTQHLVRIYTSCSNRTTGSWCSATTATARGRSATGSRRRTPTAAPPRATPVNRRPVKSAAATAAKSPSGIRPPRSAANSTT